MKNYVDAKALQEYTTKLVAKLKTLFPGTPTAAATVAEMTDHSKTYVYVGTESGYTAGDWYYWNGTAWTSGGPFQATSIITDTTLAVAGEAADAKATGDAIAAAKTAVLNAMAPAYSTSGTYAVGDYVNHNGAIYRCTTAITTGEAWTSGHWAAVTLGADLEDQVGALKESLRVDIALPGWEKGSFDTTNGANYSDNSRIRNQAKVGVSTGVQGFTLADGYATLMYAWDLSGNYVGAYKTDGSWTKTVSDWKSVTEFNLTEVPNYVVKLAMARVPSSADITAEEGANAIFYSYTDKTLSIEGKPADAKAAGDAIGNLSKSLEDIVQTKAVVAGFTTVPGEYIDGNGAFTPYTGWSRTDYIETKAETISFVCDGYSQYNFFYDSEKNPIGSKFTISNGTKKTVPNNAKYICLSGNDAWISSLVVYAGDETTELKDSFPLTETMREEVDDIIGSEVKGVVSSNAYLMKQLIPSYYFSRNDTPADKHDVGYLDDKINSIPEGDHFIFVTDTHWNDNAKQSTKLISYVKDRINAGYVLFGGDILTAYRTEAEAYRWMNDFISDFKNAFGNNFLPVVGNHDLNNTNAGDPSLMYSDLVPLFTQGCDSRFKYCDFFDDRIDAMQSEKGMTDEQVAALKQYFRTCYYVDDPNGKIRFIIYNTGAGDGGSGITQFIDSYITGSYEELLVIEWVYDTLMKTPNGYTVILSTHIPGDFSWSVGGANILSSVRMRFAAMVAGFKAKKNVTVYLPNNITDFSWWGGNTLNFNYKNAPNVGTLAVIGGHAHVDTFGKYGFLNTGFTSSSIGSIQEDVNGLSSTCYQSSTKYEAGVKLRYEVPIILTQHDAYTKNSGPNSHAMELGTVTEQVFDVVTIRKNGDIALTRFGAGNDRYLTVV